MEFVELKKGTKQPLKRHTFYKSLDDLEDGAIVLDNEPGVLFVDFDNLDENNGIENRVIKGIMETYPTCLKVKTTRGYHLYYKSDKKLKQWTGSFLNIGVQCDGKMGNCYAVIKQNGVVREYEGELSFDNITPLPDILLPMYYGKDIENLCGLQDGDGRHVILLRHLCQVRVNYDDVNIEEIAIFINKYVFDEPLDNEELKNVVESALECPIDYPKVEDGAIHNNSKNKGMLIEICKNIVEKYNIHIADNQIYYFENGRFDNKEKRLMELIYDEYEYSKSEYDEILFQLRILGVKEQEKKSIILLRNGALVNGGYVSDNKEFSSSYLDINYDSDSYDSEVDKFLQFITNNENSTEKNDLRLVLEEMIGHCLMTKNFLHKIFLLIGNGANGKSTLMNVLFSMFGDLATNVPIKKLERDDYVARLTNKLVNISDDVDFSYIKSSQNIKTLASGDIVPARELYSKAYYFRNKATMIFSMNELVIFSDHTFGMERRLCILPFENKVKKADPSILDRLTTDNAKSYLLRLGLEGMKRIKENKGQLSYSKTIENIVKNYMAENDSVYSFIEYGNFTIDNQPFSIVYEEYNNYCSRSDFTPYKKNNFSRKLKTKGYITKVKNLNGVPTRVIVKEMSN